MAYRVTAPYVTVNVLGPDGESATMLGFYKGAILPGHVDPESARRQVAKGMVEEFDAAEPGIDSDDVVEGQQAVSDEGQKGDPESDAAPAALLARPAANGSKADWLAYAVQQRAEGVSEDDARAELEPLTKAELIARFPG
jgi:hypothetical protein